MCVAHAHAPPHRPIACSTPRALTLTPTETPFLELNGPALLTCFRVLSPMDLSAAALSKMRCLRSVYGTSCWENLRSSGLQLGGLSSCVTRGPINDAEVDGLLVGWSGHQHCLVVVNQTVASVDEPGSAARRKTHHKTMAPPPPMISQYCPGIASRRRRPVLPRLGTRKCW